MARNPGDDCGGSNAYNDGTLFPKTAPQNSGPSCTVTRLAKDISSCLHSERLLSCGRSSLIQEKTQTFNYRIISRPLVHGKAQLSFDLVLLYRFVLVSLFKS